MKRSKYRPVVLCQSDAAYERQVQQEIETYLNALHSYPERAAQEPRLSFEQYLFSIAMSEHAPTPSTQRLRDEDVA
jgi:hypothetical protein